jgi:hypothetical protein
MGKSGHMPLFVTRVLRSLFAGLMASALVAISSPRVAAQTGTAPPLRTREQQSALIPILNSGDSAVMYWAHSICPPATERGTACGRFVSADSARLLRNAGDVVELAVARRTLPGRGKADDLAIPYSGEAVSDSESAEIDRMGFAIPDDEELSARLFKVMAPDSIRLALPVPATNTAGKWKLIARTPEPLYIVDGARMSFADAQRALDRDGMKYGVWMWPESFRNREGQEFWLEYYKYADSPAAANGVVKITTNKGKN